VAEEPISLVPTYDVRVTCPAGCHHDVTDLGLTVLAKPVFDKAALDVGALHEQPGGVVVASVQKVIAKMVESRDAYLTLPFADEALMFLMLVRDAVLGHRGAPVDVYVGEAARALQLELTQKEYMSAWSIANDASAESIEHAKRGSHDNVIRFAGDARRSGVSWTFWNTDDAPVLHTDEGDIPLPEEVAAMCRLHPGLPLVMATVEVEMEAPDVE
jgi:hypothetical protein